MVQDEHCCLGGVLIGGQAFTGDKDRKGVTFFKYEEFCLLCGVLGHRERWIHNEPNLFDLLP